MERLMSLRRWLPPVSSSRSSDCLPEDVGDVGLLGRWPGLTVAFCRDSLARRRAFSIVCSSRARWHWASS